MYHTDHTNCSELPPERSCVGQRGCHYKYYQNMIKNSLEKEYKRGFKDGLTNGIVFSCLTLLLISLII